MKEAYRHLDDKEVYEQVPDNPREGLSKDTLDYFLVKGSRFTRLFLLPKIHKRPHDVPGRAVILNCFYYTENISLFLDYHLHPLA